MLRLRVGILLILFSWLPIAQISVWVAHNNGWLTTTKQASEFRGTVWAVQILIGFVGLILVGKLAITEAKKEGWRKTPRHLGKLFIHGHDQSKE